MNKIKTITVKCNLCGDNNYKVLFKNYDRLHQKPGIFSVVRCRSCGLVYLSPRPKNIGEYYPDDYVPYSLPKEAFPESLTGKFLSSERYYKKQKNIIDRISAFVFERIYNPIPSCFLGKVLDIGCGNGMFLCNLKKFGWDVYGLDPSKKAVKFARDKLALKNIFLGTLENKKYPEDFFDVIILSHVIEHLPDPVRALNKIKKILRPGGLLLITTPNFASLNAKFFRQFWFPLETPRHLYLFTPDTLERMLNSVGLKKNKFSFSVSTYSLAMSLGYLFENQKEISKILMKTKFFFFPFTLFLALIKRSDIFTVYAERSEE